MHRIYFYMFKNKMDDGWKIDKWTDNNIQMMDEWMDPKWMDE